MATKDDQTKQDDQTTPPADPAQTPPADPNAPQDPSPEVEEHNQKVLEQAAEAAGEDREPADFVGISPAAYDKVGAKAVDLDRQSAYLPQEDEDLSKGVDGARTPFVEED